MSEAPHVTIERDGRILLIGVNRPYKRNSLTPEMMIDLAAALTKLNDDPELRAGVIYGEGEHFTSGLDLMQFVPYLSGQKPPLETPPVDALQLKARCKKPLIAAVQGITFTVGIELMLACDFAVAGDDTRFAQMETKRGIMVSGGGTVRWIQRCGSGNGLYHMLRGDEFGADEALRIGLVQEIVAAGKTKARAVELAHEIAANAPLAVQATKENVMTYLTQGEQAAFSTLDQTQARLATSKDAMEGVSAMMQKRTPQFAGS
jgi:enoyl-CoA hydratase/carnithine racemase